MCNDSVVVPTNFFLGGAPKAATTSVWDYLNQHPEIYMGEVKEPYYFNINWKKGISWYLDLYRKYNDERMVGDGSINLIICHIAPGRIKKIIKHAKFIFILRDPAERLYSDYMWGVNQGREPYINMTFSSYIRSEEANISLSMGLYYENILRYEAEFGNENVKVLLFDDLIADTTRMMAELYLFLCVDSTFKPVLKVSNKGRYYQDNSTYLLRWLYKCRNVIYRVAGDNCVRSLRPAAGAIKGLLSPRSDLKKSKMSDSDRKHLVDYYINSIEKLENHLNIELAHWK